MGKPEIYYDPDQWCEICDADTPHEIHETGHERDSTGCHAYCLVCGWDQMNGFYIEKDHLECLQEEYAKQLATKE